MKNNSDMEIDLKNYKFIVHDIETFKYFFCAVFKYDDKYLTYEISSRKNELTEMLRFLSSLNRSEITYLVGFNNIRFDGQVLQYLLDSHSDLIELSGLEICHAIHEFTQSVIEKANNREFPPYPEHKLENRHIDLFLQNHYNNSARSTSLKWLEYSMNWKKVQDLPYKHDDVLTEDVFDDIVKYCINDVDATDEFLSKNDKLLELRFAQQTENTDLNLLNKSDSSVGEMLFLKLMSEKLEINKNKLKKMRTHHKKIALKDVIFPYVKFKTPQFNEMLRAFQNIVLDMDSPSFKYECEYDGITYVYGIGGLHACLDNKICDVSDNPEWTMIDADVASYYPNLAIRNKLYPKHLSEQFCELYEELYDKRRAIPKSNPQNKSLKLLLNSIYGFWSLKVIQVCL